MKLQELCLAAIKDSLDRFCYAYYTTDNDDLRLRFRFLQKVYASQLVSWIDNDDILPQNCADFLFSKYLKSVDTMSFLQFPWKIIFDTFEKIGPSLEKVSFNEDVKCIESKEDSSYMRWKNIICYLPNVKSITYQTYCDNDILECIAKYCPKLETLDVNHSYGVTDDGLKYFYLKEQGKLHCPLLKEICVACPAIGFKSIKHLLKNLPLLEKIDYSQLPLVLRDMHLDDLGSLDKVERYNLKYLDLLNCAVWAQTKFFDDMLEICITLCPKVKSFYCPLFKSEHSSWCSMLLDVEDLNLDCASYTPIDVNDVLRKKGGKLTTLTLHNCSLSFSVLGQYCHPLNELTMNAVKIQYDESDSVSMFYNLKTLAVMNVDLLNPEYYKAICCILASSPNLEDLYFNDCSISSSGMQTEILKCCKQCALKRIDFGGSSVEAGFIKEILLTCSNLKGLILDALHIDAEMDDLYRTAWFVPNRPKLILSEELSEHFGDSYRDCFRLLSLLDDSDESNDNFSDYSYPGSLSLFYDSDESWETFSESSWDPGEASLLYDSDESWETFSESSKDPEELSNDSGELSEDFSSSKKLSNDYDDYR